MRLEAHSRRLPLIDRMLGSSFKRLLASLRSSARLCAAFRSRVRYWRRKAS